MVTGFTACQASSDRLPSILIDPVVRVMRSVSPARLDCASSAWDCVSTKNRAATAIRVMDFIGMSSVSVAVDKAHG
ncbi:MAG: hypothetical protein DMF96_02100 [Acidobacteria bacterium]|nr:MAG: hypothetical protein DMF96_02100 [Acidobacteriota bacterium]